MTDVLVCIKRVPDATGEIVLTDDGARVDGRYSGYTMSAHEECAVASIVGAARHDDELRAGLDAALVRPLTAAVASVGERAEARGEPVPEARLALLRSVVEAFYWQRYTVAGDGSLSAERLDRLVDDVLMPLVAPEREVAPV